MSLCISRDDATIVPTSSSQPKLMLTQGRRARIIKKIEPALAPLVFTTIDEEIGRQMSPQRFGATVLGALGGMAALLTLFGTYVLAESMAMFRRREMGVRAALGASRWQLGSLVMLETN